MGWWDTILDILPAAASAYTSYQQGQSAKDAANAQVAGGNAAIAEQRRQFDLVMQMLQPQRQLGVNAMNTLSRLYGYGNNAPAAGSPTPAGIAAPTAVPGVAAGSTTTGSNALSGGIKLGANGKPLSLKEVDPVRFQQLVDQGGKLWNRNLTPEERAQHQAWEQYTRKPSGISNISGGILGVAGAVVPGFGAAQAGTEFANNLLSSSPKTPPAVGYANESGTGGASQYTATNPVSQGPADMSVFTSSPDYQFRRDEGNRDIENSFAARGGALSGNALRGITEFNSNLASGEFNNFVQRQLQMAGLGGAATSQATNAAQYTGANVSNVLGDQGNARASGIVDRSNALTGGMNDLATWFGNWNKNRNGLVAGGTQYPWSMNSAGYG